MHTRLSTSCSEEMLRGTPLPSKTVTYTPVPNSLIFDILYDKLNEYNLHVKQTDLTMSPNGNRFIGLYDIESDNSELGYRIGFKNSYDGSMAFGMGVGSVVWLCSNGMVHGEISNKRIHRGNADKDVEEIIKMSLDQYQEKHDENVKIMTTLKEVILDTNEIYKVIGEMCYKGIMNGNELTRFKREITTSKLFNNLTNNPDGIYAWDLYNHATEVLKKASYNSYFEKHKMVNDLIYNECC